MPAPVTQAIEKFTQDQLKITVWDGEIPRFDLAGNPINPQAGGVTPTIWPVFQCTMEGGFSRHWNVGTDPYDDEGTVKISTYATTKAEVQAAFDVIEALWAAASNWSLVKFTPPGNPQNPFYMIQMLLESWWLGQEQGVRLANSQLLYRGDLTYNPCQVHGAISTS